MPGLSPVSLPQLNSPMNPVSSSEDIKPPLGLNGVLKVPAHPSGNMASFTKHICAICGDRSSGRPQGAAGQQDPRAGCWGGLLEGGLWGPRAWPGQPAVLRAPRAFHLDLLGFSHQGDRK